LGFLYWRFFTYSAFFCFHKKRMKNSHRETNNPLKIIQFFKPNGFAAARRAWNFARHRMAAALALISRPAPLIPPFRPAQELSV
jgi:hypothetical protein